MQGFWYFAEKKEKFRGIFRGKFAGKLADFAGFSRKKGKIRGKIGRFRGIFAGESQNSQKNRPISRVLAEKVKFWRIFMGKKIGQFHGKFRGETSPRNNQ